MSAPRGAVRQFVTHPVVASVPENTPLAPFSRHIALVTDPKQPIATLTRPTTRDSAILRMDVSSVTSTVAQLDYDYD
eukprot:858768-Prymnesium_polylepis.1